MAKLYEYDNQKGKVCHLSVLGLMGPNTQCPCRALLEKELESVGIRLNKSKPNIYFKVRFPGLVSVCLLKAEVNACCPTLDRLKGGGGFCRLLSKLLYCLLAAEEGWRYLFQLNRHIDPVL